MSELWHTSFLNGAGGIKVKGEAGWPAEVGLGGGGVGVGRADTRATRTKREFKTRLIHQSVLALIVCDGLR